MGYAFISYSSKNLTMANAMHDLLNDNGIQTWMAPGDIPVGSKYAQVINKAVKNCSCLVLLLSEESQNSIWVSKEVERAINYRKTIIPVQIDNVILNDEFELYISTDQVIAVQKIDENSLEMKKVIKSVLASVEVKDEGNSAENDNPEPVRNITPDNPESHTQSSADNQNSSVTYYFGEQSHPSGDGFRDKLQNQFAKIFTSQKKSEDSQLKIIRDRYPEYSDICFAHDGFEGKIYKGYDPREKRDIAIKTYPPSVSSYIPMLSDTTLFRTLQSISQENICKIIGRDLRKPNCIVMEYAPGNTLLLYKGFMLYNNWEAGEICRILLGILRGLNALHEKNIYYGDLMPSNIIITGQHTPMLCDFSESNYNDSVYANRTRTLLDNYISPEKIEGDKIDFRSDIYEFGLIVSDFLTSFENDEVRKTMFKIVDRCTRKDPTERYSSVQEIIELIEFMAAGQKIKI